MTKEKCDNLNGATCDVLTQSRRHVTRNQERQLSKQHFILKFVICLGVGTRSTEVVSRDCEFAFKRSSFLGKIDRRV